MPKGIDSLHGFEGVDVVSLAEGHNQYSPEPILTRNPATPLILIQTEQTCNEIAVKMINAKIPVVIKNLGVFLSKFSDSLNKSYTTALIIYLFKGVAITFKILNILYIFVTRPLFFLRLR